MIANVSLLAAGLVVAGMVLNALLRYLGLADILHALSLVLLSASALTFVLRPRFDQGVLSVGFFLSTGVVPFTISGTDLDMSVAVVGALGLYGYCLLWTFWLLARPRSHVENTLRWLYRLHVCLGVITTALVFYQTMLSSDIHGIMPVRPYTDLDLIDFGFTRRATAFVGSPQNLGVYMGIAAVCAFAVRSSILRAVLVPLFLAAGMLSGSAAFVLFIFLAAVAYVWGHRQRRLRFATGIALTAAMAALIVNAQRVPNLENTRMGALYIGSSEDRSQHITGLIDWHPAVLMLGHGLGTANRVTEVLLGEEHLPDVWRASESYLATVIYETGLFGLLGFALLYFGALRAAAGARTLEGRIALAILFGLAGNLATTPSFTGLTMAAIAWPFILIPLIRPGDLVVDVSVHPRSEAARPRPLLRVEEPRLHAHRVTDL